MEWILLLAALPIFFAIRFAWVSWASVRDAWKESKRSGQ